MMKTYTPKTSKMTQVVMGEKNMQIDRKSYKIDTFEDPFNDNGTNIVWNLTKYTSLEEEDEEKKKEEEEKTKREKEKKIRKMIGRKGLQRIREK